MSKSKNPTNEKLRDLGGQRGQAEGESEKRKPLFESEALEPRILLSATWVDMDAGDEIDGPADGAAHSIESEAADIAQGHGGTDLLEGLGGDDQVFSGATGDYGIFDGGQHAVRGSGEDSAIHTGGSGVSIDAKEREDTAIGDPAHNPPRGGEESETQLDGVGAPQPNGGKGADSADATHVVANEPQNSGDLDGAEAPSGDRDGSLGVPETAPELVKDVPGDIQNDAGDDGGDVIRSHGYTDVLGGTDGGSGLLGQEKENPLLGSSDDDEIHGGHHTDTIYGGEGDDRLYGGHHDDVLVSGGGNDLMDGGKHDDTFRFDGAEDGDEITVIGGHGKDRIDLSGFSSEDIDDDGSTITVRRSDGGAFHIRYSDIEFITTADGDFAPGEVRSDQAPNADAGPDWVVDENELVTLSSAASGDPDIEDTLSYEWVQASGPKVTLDDPSSPNPTFTAPEGVSNTDLTFELRVSDGESTSVDVMTVTVNADNDAPSADAGPDQLVTEHDVVQLSGAGVDPEGRELAYEWVQTGGPTVELNDPTAADPTFTPPDVQESTTLTFELRVSDGESTSIDTVNVTVTATNDAPIAEDGDSSTAEDTAAAVTLAGSDSDVGDQVESYRIESLPANGALKLHGQPVAAGDVVTAVDVAGGALTFEPAENWHGKTDFEFSAYDGEEWSEQPATSSIEVSAVDDAPDATDDSMIETYRIDRDYFDYSDIGDIKPGAPAGVTVTGLYAQGSAENLLEGKPELQTLSGHRYFDHRSLGRTGYNYMGGHNWFEENGINTSELRNGVITFSDGTVGLIGTAYDGVDRPNWQEDAYIYYRAYDVEASNMLSTAEDTTLALNASALLSNDVDVDTPTELLRVVSVQDAEHGTVELTDEGKIEFTPDKDFHGTATFTYTVEDADGNQDTATVSVAVLPVDDAPVVDAGLDQTVEEGERVKLSVNATDPEGQGLTYTWVQTSGPEVTLDDPTSPNPTFSAPQVDDVTTITFEVEVSDGNETRNDAVDVVVNPANQAPEAIDGNVTTAEDTAVAVMLSSSDPDAGDQVESYRIESLPAGGMLKLHGQPVAAGDVVSAADVTDGALAFEPGDNWDGETAFEFSAYDGEQWSDEPATFGIEVTSVNDAPIVVADGGEFVLDGQALHFGGGDDSVLLPDLDVNTEAGTEVTVEFWMKWDGSDNVMPFGFDRYDLWFKDGNFGLNTGNGDLYGIDASGLQDGWHHVTAVFHNGDATESRLFIDGVEQDMAQQRSTPNNRCAVAGAEGHVSGWGVNGDYRFRGEIDELRIWNGERGPEDVVASMRGEFSPDAENLVAAYDFSGAEATPGGVTDVSGNGHDGTMIGMTEANVVDVHDTPDFGAQYGDQVVTEGERVRLAVMAYDPEGEALTYTWTQVDGPKVELNDGHLANPSFTAPNLTETQDLTFEVAVSDGENTTVETVRITVEADNDAPVIHDAALHFGGGDDSVLLPDLDVNTEAGTEVTVEFWMKWDGSDNVMPFGFDRYDLWFKDGNFGFNTGNGDLYGIDASGLQDGWHHVTAVFHNGDATESHLFIDGVEQDMTQQRSTPNNRCAVAGAEGHVSGWGVNGGYKFRGEIDELRIWNGERGPEDVVASMRGEFSPDAENLVAAYDFSGAEATPGGVTDVSGNGHDGTMIGMDEGNVVESGVNQQALEVDAGERVQLAISATDPEGQSLRYEWVQVSGPKVELDDPHDAQPGFSAPRVGGGAEIVFEVHVSDGENEIVDTVTVKVHGDPLTVEAGDDFAVDEGAAVWLHASANHGPPALDLSGVEIESYGGSGQDVELAVSVEDAGATLHLQGNGWKSVDLPHTVTEDTILEFDFRSDHEGEIHGIGFDNDAGLNGDRTFQLHGTQGWGIRAQDDYEGDGQWKHYRIRVGDYFTGEFDRLTFANDHDVANPDGDSFFANVRVYEESDQGISYEWRQTSGPTVELSDPHTADPTFTAPDLLTNSQVTFEVAVTEQGETVTDTITVTINADDDAPTADAGEDMRVADSATVTLSGAGVDPEGEGLTYEWVQVSGPDVALSDPSAAEPTFTAPAVTEDTELVFELRVSDGAHTSIDTVTVEVHEVLSVDAGEDQVVSEDDVVTLNAAVGTHSTVDSVAFDADAIHSYGGSGQDVELAVSVEDAGATLYMQGNGWKSVDLPYTVTEDTILEFDFRSDHEGEIHGIGFDNDAGLNSDRTFQLHGTQGWGIRAHDDYEGDGQWRHYTIRVGDYFTGEFDRLTFANDHDVANPDGDSFFSNVRVYEDGSQTVPADPTYTWRQTGGPSVALSDASSATPTFDAPDVQEPTVLTFEVEVSDGTRVRTDTVDITVNPVNHGPTADAGPDLAVDENELVTLSSASSGDPDIEDTLSYDWVQTSGPKVTLDDPSSPNPTFTAPEGVSNTDLTFELRVSDGESTSVDVLTVTVNADNDAPSADAGCDDYATKPIDRKKLIETIRHYAEKGQAGMREPTNETDRLISDLADDPDLADLVEEFVAELPARVQALEQACADADLDALARLAHQLKGSAGGYGFPSITDMAAELEKRAKAKEDLDALRHAVQQVVDLCRRATAGAISNRADETPQPSVVAEGDSF